MCFVQKLFYGKTLIVQQGVMTNFKIKIASTKRPMVVSKMDNTDFFP
jgi:hypothetical protein